MTTSSRPASGQPPQRETHVLEPRRARAGADSDVDSRADVPLERPVAPNDGELSSVRLPRELVRPAVDQHTDAPVVARVRPVEPTVHASTLPPALPVSSRDPAGRGARASVSDMPFARLDRPRPVLEPPAARPPVVAAHVGSRPARPVPAQSAVTRVGSDAENTIHVTIGRVEIRAASASPASRSSASTSSAMTLGEYPAAAPRAR